MKKVYFLLLAIIVIGQNVLSADSTKVQILLNISANTIITKPDFYNITGNNYYTAEKSLGIGYSGDISFFFTKNIGIEAGFTSQNIPTKVRIDFPINYTYNILPFNTENKNISKNIFISIGPSFKIKVLKKILLGFNSSILFSKNIQQPKGWGYTGLTDTSYSTYYEVETLDENCINFMLKPYLILEFNDYLTMKLNYIARFSQSNIADGNYIVLPDYPTLHSTADYVQETSYRGFSLGLELNISSIAKSISNKFKSEK
ncbi:MAG: hypothetical protein JXR68_07730 [Bacteroidales bacterium]|nr:hypothetical protein [Bacteroidales bacterium]